MTLQDRIDALPEDVFVGGPRKHFESRGRLQLITLLRMGMYPSSKVLDLGCGCLRGGYWLIHFLNADGYCGIEPDRDAVRLGLDTVLEPETRQLKRPRFDHNADFNFGVFGEKFDFVIARSVWTHTSKEQIELTLDSFKKATNEDGLFLTSYKPAGVLRKGDFKGKGWRGRSDKSDEVKLVGHSFEWVQQVCGARGLAVRELEFDFLAQPWLAVARAGVQRPTDAFLEALRGPLWYNREKLAKELYERSE